MLITYYYILRTNAPDGDIHPCPLWIRSWQQSLYVKGKPEKLRNASNITKLLPHVSQSVFRGIFLTVCVAENLLTCTD